MIRNAVHLTLASFLMFSCSHQEGNNKKLGNDDGNDENPGTEPADTTPVERAMAHSFPRLANQYQACCWDPQTETNWDRLQSWDLVVIDAEIFDVGQAHSLR